MPRARNIKPAFFHNEDLGGLPPIERLAFIGMWTVADFKGCIELRSKRIKVQILPYDNCDFEEIAINLHKAGFIKIYTFANQRYIKIINFEKHQNPHKNEREAGSNIPDIGAESNNCNVPNEITINPEIDGTDPADSLFLNPSSLIPEENIPQAVPSLLSFDQFWHAYPKKTAKRAAENAFEKIKAAPELLDIILKAITDQKKSKAWLDDEGKYIQNPATWLNGKRWEDEVTISANFRPTIPFSTIPNLPKGTKPEGLDIKALVKKRHT